MDSLRDMRKRITGLDPLVVDTSVAVVLTVLVCGLIYLFTSERPQIPDLPNVRMAQRMMQHLQPRTPWVAYLLAIGTFMPLALRRKIPWLALALSGGFALAYTFSPGTPPMPVVFAPMLALYTFAARATQRRSGLMALLVAAVVALVPVFAFSSTTRWVSELVGTFLMLAAAALLGESERNRREYIREVEARAAEAERTREEEALRRVDEERIRIAREVHDIVAHSLSIVTVQASAAETLLEGGDRDKTREAILNIRATGKSALAELRSMLDVLRTGEGDAPLAPAADITRLDQLVATVQEAGLEVDVHVRGDLQGLPAYAGVSAYRIVQEALTNAVRHAQATSAQVELIVGAETLSVAVRDNGIGAEFADEASLPGHGIHGMRERTEALGGSFGTANLPAGGFQVSASIPLARSGT